MGPRLFSRGNLADVNCKSHSKWQLQWGRGCSAAEILAVGWPQEQPESCFNGAAAVQPRKLDFWAAESTPANALQWGRGCSAAEIGMFLDYPAAAL